VWVGGGGGRVGVCVWGGGGGGLWGGGVGETWMHKEEKKRLPCNDSMGGGSGKLKREAEPMAPKGEIGELDACFRSAKNVS